SGMSSGKIHSVFMGGLIQGLRYGSEVFGGPAGGSSHQGDGRHGDPLVYNGDPVFFLNLPAGLHQVSGRRGDLVINLPVQPVQISVNTVHKADSQGDG